MLFLRIAHYEAVKRSIGGLLLDEKQVDVFRGKFRRLCEPKRTSGEIEIPSDIHEQYMAKGATRERLFEAFIKTGGLKDRYAKILQNIST